MSPNDNARDNGGRVAVSVRGRVSSGLGEGTFFTELPWAKTQFIAKLSIDPFPGTFNVSLDDPEEQEKVATFRAHPGVTIMPDSPQFCAGITYGALINDSLRGAAVFPAVDGYPSDKLEIIAPVNVKLTLRVVDGDSVTVELFVL